MFILIRFIWDKPDSIVTIHLNQLNVNCKKDNPDLIRENGFVSSKLQGFQIA